MKRALFWLILLATSVREGLAISSVWGREMKKLIAILLIAFIGSAQSSFAQFNAIIYNTGCELADACVGGTGYPDGTKTVQIFWDADNNGPTPNDVQPVVGDGSGECNFNSLLLNGEGLLGCAGSFFTDPAFTIVTTTPQPSKYWFRVCDDANSIMWISDTLTIANGLNEYDLTASGGWICVEDTVCGGCQAPPAVQGVQASDNSCANVTISWTAYPAEDGVDSLFVYMDNTNTQIARVHRTVTQFVYTAAPEGTRNYLVSARRICDGDTALSTPTSDFGTRVQSPLVPADTSVTVTTHPTQCGAVIVRWRVPNSIASIDSFCVFQNGVEVNRTGPGTAGQVIRDTIFTALSGVQQYRIAGWSVECGHGTQTSQFPGTATQAPAQVTGLTASTGLCNVNLAWTAVPGATSYIVRRNGTQIGTPATNSFTDATATPNTVFSYTVSAFVSTNPTACQEGAQSTSANGSRIGTPNAPTSVIASDSVFCTHVAISWTDNSADEDSFYVRRDGVNIRAVPANTTSFNDSTAIQGTNHNYTVAARNPCGTSAFATVNSGSKKQLPTQVTGVSASDNLSDRVTVTWNNVIRETNFRVLRNGSMLATVAQDVLTYDDMTAVNGVRYSYAVVAFNECGDGATSPADSGGIIPYLLAPINVNASDSSDCFAVTLTWSDMNAWEDGFFIQRDGFNIAVAGQNSVSYIDSTAVPFAIHLYSVAAFNQTDTSEYSESDPGSLSRNAPPTFGVWATDHLVDRVLVGWTDISGESGFRVIRDSIPIADVPANTTFYEDFTAIPLMSHYYTVIALASCGEGIPASFDYGRIPCVRPSAIEGFQVSAGECALVLTWQDLENEDYYVILRDGVWRANIGQNSTTYVDDQAAGNTTYTYSMYGQNGCSNGPETAQQSGFRFATPNLVTGVQASDSLCGEILISWNDVDYEDGYMIRQNGIVIGFTQPNVSSYTVPSVTGRHSFRVQAFNPCGASFNSLSDSGGTDTVPAMLTLLTSSPDCQGITLSYAATVNTDSVILWRDGYVIAVQSGGLGSYEDFPPTGGIYTYSAQAIGNCGASNVLDNVSGQLLDYPMGPAEASAISDSCETITVSWVPALGDFGYYEVFRDGVLLATLPNTSVSYEDANAVGGNTYAYTVVAVNDTCGASMDSTTVEIELVPGSTPAAPEVVITTEGLDAHLSWSVVDTSVSGCAVSGLWYAVFYSPTSGGPFYYHGWTPDTTYTHEGVVNFSATQFYQVTAVDAPSALASSFVKGMEMGEVLGKIGKRKEEIGHRKEERGKADSGGEPRR